MPIAPSFYSNYLPTVCVTLSNRVLRFLTAYSAGELKANDEVVDTLENVFRLLEMYRTQSLAFDNPSGVLGADPRLAEDLPKQHLSVAPTELVEAKLGIAIREAFGEKVDANAAIEQIEGVLGTVAYAAAPAADDATFERARTFFGALRDHLSEQARAGLVVV